ncbi:hypothetical protein HW555_000803 [Spodoptera exigua]|uniref:Uncharacterized protein n=1 Tax=Spodoptera exigua TaxID=7107 RepID=A0A835GST3_SPOEX|nr:hypothetical protein HW555_000803 [Spodoptera exigua]
MANVEESRLPKEMCRYIEKGSERSQRTRKEFLRIGAMGGENSSKAKIQTCKQNFQYPPQFWSHEQNLKSFPSRQGHCLRLGSKKLRSYKKTGAKSKPEKLYYKVDRTRTMGERC